MIYKVGIYDGDFVGKNNGNKIYQLWVGMLKRCYGKNIQNSYIGTEVCDEWKLYSNFKNWFEQNYIDGYFLDKDLIGGVLKLYSPSTCAFVPRKINNLILDSNSKGSIYPLGVCFHKKKEDMINEYKNPFYSQLNNKNLGSFDTPEKAHKAWQIAKKKVIESAIIEYTGVLDDRVIQSLQLRVDILQHDIDNNFITKTLNKI